MSAVISQRVKPLSGSVWIPGDKSISHRALIIAASAVGESNITGLLEGLDVLKTVAALRLLGVEIEKNENGSWSVYGRGVGGLSKPTSVLDMGNSGTGARLLMGLTAAHSFKAIFSGDTSLSYRPMDRVMAPLRRMGATFDSLNESRLPLTVYGSDMLRPVTEKLSIASAQVKSAILLAGLNTLGETTVIEPLPTRDHTENMLSAFGARIQIQTTEQGKSVSLTGQPELSARKTTIPADPSSAAFPIVAALISPGSTVRLRGICLNPLRTGFLRILGEMGAQINTENHKTLENEIVGDIFAEFGDLKGIRISSESVPSMIDEYPILAVAAACADGETAFEGISELRLKESDRVNAIATGLRACGVQIKETQDSLVIIGRGKPPPGGARILSNMDHRIAMAFLVLGMVSENPVTVDDVSSIDTSFPDFVNTMNLLGGSLQISV